MSDIERKFRAAYDVSNVVKGVQAISAALERQNSVAEQAARSAKELSDSMRQLENAAKGVRDNLSHIHKSLSSVDKSFKSNNQALATSAQRFKEIESGVNRTNQALATATQYTSSYQGIQKVTLGQQRQMAKAFGTTSAVIGETGRRTQEVSTSVQGVNRAVSQSTTSNRRLHSSLSDVNLGWETMSRLVISRVLQSGLSQITRLVTQTTQEFAQLAVSISEIQTISQSAFSLGALRSVGEIAGDTRRLSDAFNIPQLEVLEASYQAISNQVRGAAESFNFITEAAFLAKASASTLNESVEILTATLNAFNVSTARTSEVAAALFRSKELGRLRLSDMSKDLGRSAVLANQLGVSLEELLGTFAGITIQGVKFSNTQTFVTNQMLKLLKPTDRMKEILNEWGVASSEAAISAFGWLGVMQRLESEFLKGTDRLGEAAEAWGTIRAIIGGTIVGDNAEQIAKSIQMIQDAEDSYLTAFQLRMQNQGEMFQRELQKIKNFLVSDIGRSIFEVLMTINDSFISLTTVVKALTAAVAPLSATWLAAVGVLKFLEAQQLKAAAATSAATAAKVADTAATAANTAALAQNAGAVSTWLARMRGLGSFALMAGKVAIALGAVYFAFRLLTRERDIARNFEDLSTSFDSLATNLTNLARNRALDEIRELADTEFKNINNSLNQVIESTKEANKEIKSTSEVIRDLSRNLEDAISRAEINNQALTRIFTRYNRDLDDVIVSIKNWREDYTDANREITRSLDAVYQAGSRVFNQLEDLRIQAATESMDPFSRALFLLEEGKRAGSQGLSLLDQGNVEEGNKLIDRAVQLMNQSELPVGNLIVSGLQAQMSILDRLHREGTQQITRDNNLAYAHLQQNFNDLYGSTGQRLGEVMQEMTRHGNELAEGAVQDFNSIGMRIEDLYRQASQLRFLEPQVAQSEILRITKELESLSTTAQRTFSDFTAQTRDRIADTKAFADLISSTITDIRGLSRDDLGFDREGGDRGARLVFERIKRDIENVARTTNVDMTQALQQIFETQLWGVDEEIKEFKDQIRDITTQIYSGEGSRDMLNAQKEGVQLSLEIAKDYRNIVESQKNALNEGQSVEQAILNLAQTRLDLEQKTTDLKREQVALGQRETQIQELSKIADDEAQAIADYRKELIQSGLAIRDMVSELGTQDKLVLADVLNMDLPTRHLRKLESWGKLDTLPDHLYRGEGPFSKAIEDIIQKDLDVLMGGIASGFTTEEMERAADRINSVMVALSGQTEIASRQVPQAILDFSKNLLSMDVGPENQRFKDSILEQMENFVGRSLAGTREPGIDEEWFQRSRDLMDPNQIGMSLKDSFTVFQDLLTDVPDRILTTPVAALAREFEELEQQLSIANRRLGVMNQEDLEAALAPVDMLGEMSEGQDAIASAINRLADLEVSLIDPQERLRQAIENLTATIQSTGGQGVSRFATGGKVPGVGNSDTVPAMLTPGEYVINKDAARSLGYNNLDGLNRGRFNPRRGTGDTIINNSNSFEVNSTGSERIDAKRLFNNLTREMSRKRIY